MKATKSKETPAHKTGDISSKKGHENNKSLIQSAENSPLSRSASDLSNCASSARPNNTNTRNSKTLLHTESLLISTSNNNSGSDLPSPANDQTSHLSTSENCSSLSVEEKTYSERSSFKVEDILYHQPNSEERTKFNSVSQLPSYSIEVNNSEFFDCEVHPASVNTKEQSQDISEHKGKTIQHEDENGVNSDVKRHSELTSNISLESNFIGEYSSQSCELIHECDTTEFIATNKHSTSETPSTTQLENVFLESGLLNQETSLHKNNSELFDAASSDLDLSSHKELSGDKITRLEFVFEDSKKSLKPPPNLLSRKNQKRGSKNKHHSNKKKLSNKLSPVATNSCSADVKDLNLCENEACLSSNKLESLNSEESQILGNIETEICCREPQSVAHLLTNEETNIEINKICIDTEKSNTCLTDNVSSAEISDRSANCCSLNDEIDIANEDKINDSITYEINSAPCSLNSNTSEKTSLTFEPFVTRNTTLSKEKHSLSIISISCYGNEEFEILGNEANKLAEELTNTEKSRKINSINMDGCSSSQGSLSLERDDQTAMSLNKRDSLVLQVGDSEAGPDIATGLTSNDLKCASEFFREAAELESQIRRNISSSVGSYADYVLEGDRSSCVSEGDLYKPGIPSSPPHEERSAPEGTSSPDPKSLEDSEMRNRLPRSSNCTVSSEVNELLKKQALEFEEKLLRQGIVAAEKEKELHEMLKDEQKQMQKVTSSRDALLKLVEQYKGMLASLVSEKDKANRGQEEKLKTLDTEKQQAIEDLTNVEAAFSDVHRKYERTKQIVDTLRRNEDTLRTAVEDYEQKLLKQERKFTELQKHAEEKVQLANEEFESLRRSNDQEMTKMGALLKKAEMKIISLQENLERKNRENQELTQLCDDLISKVGS